MSKQRTEYRDDATDKLVALVREHVQGHHMGELVFLPQCGRCYVTAVEPASIERINNNAEDCIAVHVIRVRA